MKSARRSSLTASPERSTSGRSSTRGEARRSGAWIGDDRVDVLGRRRCTNPTLAAEPVAIGIDVLVMQTRCPGFSVDANSRALAPSRVTVQTAFPNTNQSAASGENPQLPPGEARRECVRLYRK